VSYEAKQPTPSEWKILRAVSDLGPCAASDVVERLGGREDWSVSTVKTLLRRLTDKGLLRTKRVGNSFLYSPTRTAAQALRRAGETLLGWASERTVGPLLQHLVQQSDLSPDDLDALRDLIDRKSKEANR
jgi:predicted transcriptional regulator